MKYLLPILLSTLLYSADSGVYVELNINNPSENELKIEDTKVAYDKGSSGSIAIGYQMDRLRFELENNYSENDISTLDGESISNNLIRVGGLANIYYSAYNETQLVSSLGIGVGATNVNVDGDTKKTALTYQGSVSLGYMVDQDWTWSMKYRYLDMRDIDSESTFSLGLRYLF